LLCLVLSCLVLSCHALSCPVMPCLVLSRPDKAARCLTFVAVPPLPTLATLVACGVVVLDGQLQLLYQLMGTPSYMAPESILHGMYGKEVDW